MSTALFELGTQHLELRTKRRAVVLGHGLNCGHQLKSWGRIFERLVDDRSGNASVELQRDGHSHDDLCISEADVLSDDVLDTLCLVLGDSVLGESDEGTDHGELLKCLQVEKRLDSLDVDRCAKNAAQREDECGHGAALLITWRYAW